MLFLSPLQGDWSKEKQWNHGACSHFQKQYKRMLVCQYQLPYLARISWQQHQSTVFCVFWDLGNAKSLRVCSVAALKKATCSILLMWKLKPIQLNHQECFQSCQRYCCLQIYSLFWAKIRDAPPCWHNLIRAQYRKGTSSRI